MKFSSSSLSTALASYLSSAFVSSAIAFLTAVMSSLTRGIGVRGGRADAMEITSTNVSMAFMARDCSIHDESYARSAIHQPDVVSKNSLVSTTHSDKKKACEEKTSNSWMSSATLALSSQYRRIIHCARCVP